jgi:hypothetical protein
MHVRKIVSTALFILTTCTLTVLAQKPAVETPAFSVCMSDYALCTFSECGKPEAQGKTVACSCRVRQGYSVGTECEGPKKNSAGQTILRSRYYPIPGYARCSNSKPWAMCLDATCTVDPKDIDPADKKPRAKCTCGVLKDKGDYLVTNSCPTGIISSATVLDLDQITDFLETQDKIPVNNFVVLNPKQK